MKCTLFVSHKIFKIRFRIYSYQNRKSELSIGGLIISVQLLTFDVRKRQKCFVKWVKKCTLSTLLNFASLDSVYSFSNFFFLFDFEHFFWNWYFHRMQLRCCGCACRLFSRKPRPNIDFDNHKELYSISPPQWRDVQVPSIHFLFVFDENLNLLFIFY